MNRYNLNNSTKLPEGWRLVRLGEICNFKRGPFGGSLRKEIFIKDGYKVYEQQHAIRNNFEIGHYCIPEEKYFEMVDFSIKPNDLIISCSGTMGKIAIVPHDAKPGIINQALLKLTPKAGIVLSNFIKYILESDNIQNSYFKNTSGAAIKNVASVSLLKTIPIPLPPLPEQKRIAAILNEQMAAVEKARAAAEAQREAAKALQGAYLKEVFESQTAKNWSKKRCQELIDVRDGTHDTPKYVDKGVPLITSKNLKLSGLDFTNVQFISREDHEQIKKRSQVDVGDILFAMIGTIGNPVIVNTNREFSIKNVGLFKMNNSPLNRDFSFFVLQSSIVTKQLDKTLQGGIQKFVSLNVLRNLMIPLPSPAEQESIATMLHNQMAETERLRKSIDEQLNTIKSLPASLLRQAFSGEL